MSQSTYHIVRREPRSNNGHKRRLDILNITEQVLRIKRNIKRSTAVRVAAQQALGLWPPIVVPRWVPKLRPVLGGVLNIRSNSVIGIRVGSRNHDRSIRKQDSRRMIHPSHGTLNKSVRRPLGARGCVGVVHDRLQDRSVTVRVANSPSSVSVTGGTELSTVESENLAIWELDKVDHDTDFRQRVFPRVGPRDIRSELDTRSRSGICWWMEIGCSPSN